MTTCIYINGTIASDSKVTSGTDINPVFFKKTFAIDGELFDEKLIGACIAGNAFRKKKFIKWLEGGAKEEKYVPFFQQGLQALILTDVGIWLYQNGEFLEGWEGVSIGSGGAKATSKFNAMKQLNMPCTINEAMAAALCPLSGDAMSGGMVQWISRGSKGTTDMPATISPEEADKWAATVS